MINGIVFDLDGTLLDHDGAERAALEKLYPTLLAGENGPQRGLLFQTSPPHGMKPRSVGGNVT